MLSPETLDSSLHVPEYIVAARGQISKPDTHDRNGGIDTFLTDAPVMCIAGDHCLRLLPATKPHGTGNISHNVGWIDQPSPQVGAWSPDSPSRIAQDGQFLRTVEEYATSLQQADAGLNAYMVIGFALPEDGTQFTYSHGLQSIQRYHIHFCQRQNGSQLPDRYLDPANPDDLEKIGIFGNWAGEASIGLLERLLLEVDFQSAHTFYQGVGPPKEQTGLERTLFGFPNLETALNRALGMIDSAKKIWRNHVETVFNLVHTVDGYRLQMRQSPTPGASIIIPSPDLRDMWQIPPESKVLVQPLAVCGPPNILAPGGAMYTWKKQSTVTPGNPGRL